MSPVTRSATRPNANSRASSSKRPLERDRSSPDDDAGSPPAESDIAEHSQESTLQGLLKRAFGGAKSLERENEALRKKVKALERKLERVQEADDVTVRQKRGKRAAAEVATSRSEVQRLKRQVLKLERSNEKRRRELHEMRMREVKTEANELVGDAEFEVGDAAYKMRKLLQEFRDLMEANTLGEDEECPICMENLVVKKCKSLPCQHMFCEGCISQLKPEAGGCVYDDEVDSIRCPQCRKVCRRDDVEVIEQTASEQWDALLEVAQKWARMDVPRADDTSEEEAEEEFIDDGEEEDTGKEEETDTRTIASDGTATTNPLETSPELEAAPQTQYRLRRRSVVITPVASPEPEDPPPQATADPSTPQGNGAPSTQSPGASTSSGRPTRSYANSPTNDKRKILDKLVESRAKKRRL
ncbi:hypothetical protein C8Q76DRAFT_719590 [Earliella scabrosa]|nr:hypothetical protein C8Q76DRAFT_719590 [Earliella scabrosa]